MGYQAYNKAVYGKKVTRANISKTRNKRCCAHSLPNEEIKFCPECGKPAYKKVNEFILDESDPNPGILGYFYSDPDDTEDLDSEMILGFNLVNNNDEVFNEIQMPTLEQKAELIQFMTENGIEFKEDDLKLYSFIYHSY